MNVSKALATYNLRGHYAGGLWTLFAISAFPPHVWTLILFLRDFGWIGERSNAWDAFGVAAYSLLFAFIETLLIFAGVLLLGLLIHPTWGTNRRIHLLGVLVLITAVWGIAGQLYFLWGGGVPAWLAEFLTSTGHPLRTIYILLALLIVPTVIVPVYFLLRSDKAVKLSAALIERLALLSALYLFLDVVAVAIVVIRNL
jgi:hypothetical protein